MQILFPKRPEKLCIFVQCLAILLLLNDTMIILDVFGHPVGVSTL